MFTTRTPNAAPLCGAAKGVRLSPVMVSSPHGVPAHQPCGLRVEIPSRLGPEIPEGSAQRAGGPAVQAALPGDRRTLRVHGGGAGGHVGPRPRVRLGPAPLESGGTGQRAEERLGEAAVQGVPSAARSDVGRGTVEQRVLRPGHRRCGDRGGHPAIYPLPACA